MPNENAYERFRTELTMNLCNCLEPGLIQNALKAVDITMGNYEVSQKQMEIITTTGVPEVVKYYLASRAIASLSLGTLKQYRYRLVDFFTTMNKSYTDITANDFRLYLTNYKITHHASDCYLETIRGIIATFYKWLLDNEYITKNPCAKVDKIKYQRAQRQPLSSFDLEVFRWNTYNVREKAIVDFFYSTGCRVSECANVKLSDINWEERSVIIRHGKGNKTRIVYFNAEAELTIKEYLKTRNDDNDALFVSVKSPHQPLGIHALQNIIREISKRTNMHVYPHKLRHTFATVGIRGGMPIEELQQLLGHADPKTTLIYAKQDQTNIRHDHKRIYA